MLLLWSDLRKMAFGQKIGGVKKRLDIRTKFLEGKFEFCKWCKTREM